MDSDLKISQKKSAVFWPLVVLIGFFYIFINSLILGNPPLDAGDDIQHIQFARNLSYKEIVGSFFSFNQDRQVLGVGTVLTHAKSSRIGQTFLLKILYACFGEHDRLYYLFQLTTGALCLVLMAYLTFLLCGSVFFALFAGFFYFFLPTAFIHNVWLSDGAEQTHLFILISFILFIKIHRLLQRGNDENFKGLLSGTLLSALTVISFLACKMRSSGYIVPLAIIAYALFTCKDYFKKRIFVALFIFSVLFMSMGFPMKAVRMHPDGAEAARSSLVKLSHVFQMVFMNTQNEFENERTCALFNTDSVLPTSVARNIGFIFLWLGVVSILILFVKRKIRRSGETGLVLIWFFLVVGLFSLADTAPRYLTDALIPLFILMAILFKTTRENLSSKKTRLLFGALLIAGVLFNAINNFQHILCIRNRKVSALVTTNKVYNEVYNDFSGKPKPYKNLYSDLVKFSNVYDIGTPRGGVGPVISDLVAYCDIKEVMAQSYDPQRVKGILRRYSRAYWITQEGAVPPDKNFILVDKFTGIEGSPIVDFISQFKKKKHNVVIAIFVKVKNGQKLSE